MGSVRRISVISIPVSDPDRAKDFYDKVLGFDLLADEEFGEGRRWIQLAPEGRTNTSVALVTWLEDYPPGSVRGNLIEVRDLDEARVELTHRGLEFDGEVDETPWGRFLAFADPDGNRWSLHEPSGPAAGGMGTA
jgi:catechol 2,3-dioxygenase-like lactoylglutathione lyase family enzyme